MAVKEKTGKRYDFSAIEKKWQDKWEQTGIFQAPDKT